jgi:hypothetical protein
MVVVVEVVVVVVLVIVVGDVVENCFLLVLFFSCSTVTPTSTISIYITSPKLRITMIN